MPDLTVEVTRTVIQNLIYAMPLEKDASGNVLDIFDPPFSIQRTTLGPLSSVSFELIVETLTVQAVVGSPQATVSMHFDNSSIEILATGDTVGLLSGDISLTATLAFQPDPSLPKVVFGIDFTNAAPTLTLDPASRAKLVSAVGSLADAIIDVVTAAATAALSDAGFVSSGFELGMTPGVASEDMLTVTAIPVVVWVDAETLAITAEYDPAPTGFSPVASFLEKDPIAIGLELSPDGFQRVVRNPAVRALAQDSLSDRLVPQFAQDAYVKRGGTGGVSPADTANGQTAFAAYLKTTDGQKALANETPAPVGSGFLLHHVTGVPDPFSDFDVHVYYVDLWLGDGRIAGQAKANGNVNGFKFDATIDMWCTPVITGKSTVEFQDFSIGEPDISIDLPTWLKWATVLLGGYIGTPIAGIVAPYLLAAVLSQLADSLVPTGSLGGSPSKPQSLGALPKGLEFDTITVTTEYLLLSGIWYVEIDDPKGFYPRVSLVPTVSRTAAGPLPDGFVSANCLGGLGIVLAGPLDPNLPPGPNTFAYTGSAWTSTVTFTVTADAIPLPLTYFAWTVQFGYLDPEDYGLPVDPSATYPLVIGVLDVNTTVWHPVPPMEGSTEAKSLAIAVTSSGEGSYTLSFPVEAACLWVSAATKVIDATGVHWDITAIADVFNETILMGSDFIAFKDKCGAKRRTVHFTNVTTVLDTLWNPGPIISGNLQTAIRNRDSGVGSQIGELVKAGGEEALRVLLSPSKLRREN